MVKRIPDAVRRTFTEAFTARDVLEHLVSFEWDDEAGEVRERLEEAGFDVAGIRTLGRMVGYVRRERLTKGCCRDFLEPFDSAVVVDIETPLPKVVLALKEVAWAFVSRQGGITGIITRDDFQKPAVRMWVFGIVTLIEQRFTKLIERHCPEDAWQSCLTESRLRKAKELQVERQRRQQEVRLIDCLQLADKGRIIAQTEDLRKSTVFASKRQAEAMTKKVEQLRNNLAHSQDIVISDWETIVLLCEFAIDRLGLTESDSESGADSGGERESDSPQLRGRSAPLGATVTGGGVNFSLFSRHASRVELLFFEREDDAEPAMVFPFDPVSNRTYHYWHLFVPGARAGQIYGYRVSGPPTTNREDLRFDSTKVLLDPYGRATVVPSAYEREGGSRSGSNAATAMKSVVVDSSDYDWEGDVPLRLPASRSIIYEMHVRGFTQHPNSGVAKEKRGTYAGLIEKIPFLKELGITAVELLPVFQFDMQDCPRGKVNYWGYAPISFFSPHAAYSSRRDPMGPVDEFRDMVKALHRAGIEVILDVVFNHTSEGNEQGPTQCFRGIDNPTYYILEERGRRYANYTGCGNTLNANHPVVRRMIVDSLRYWVEEMHVDGFRFDLASILSRDSNGHPMPNPPVLWDIESDPVLSKTKLLAEAWDAAGLYQVGSFVGDAWKEWNGRFRDDVRDFLRGAPGAVGKLADRMVGSPQIYGHKQREAEQSVNFVTCHDGFTLNDLVSYNQKHNEENGEGNRDGCDDNRSWNCGIEGPTDDSGVEAIRNRQTKNFLTITLMSLGLPMISMGDEVRRTQRGNNNAYCQDNEISWFDWSGLERHGDVLRFLKLLISRRLMRNSEHEENRVSLTEMLEQAEKEWHGVRLSRPDWSDQSHSIAFETTLKREQLKLYVILNAYWEPLEFELPRLPGGRAWRRWVDTALATPEDIVSWASAVPLSGGIYRAESRSVVMLLGNLS